MADNLLRAGRRSVPALYIAGGITLLLIAVLARVTEDGTLLTFITRFMGLFVEAAPFLLLGALISGVIGAFVLPADIARVAPRNGFAGAVTGSMLGFVFPVCECGVIPVVRRLFAKGLPLSTGVAFLLAAPVMNVVVLLSTSAAFGWGTVLAARFIITGIVAIVVGVIFSYGAVRERVLRPQVMVPISGGATDSPMRRPGLTEGVQQGLGIAMNDVFTMGRLLVIGCLLAAAMQTLVDREALLDLGSGPLSSVIVMQSLGFLLSVCSTVDAFLALAFTGAFTTGSIIAFLTFGPMVDVKSAAMFMGVFKPRAVIYLIALPLAMTMLFAVWFNLNVGI